MYDTNAREDAVRHNGRWFIPTIYGTNSERDTKWVSNWDEFREAKGVVCWVAEQAGIELHLPAPYKFSIQFARDVGAVKEPPSE